MKSKFLFIVSLLLISFVCIASPMNTSLTEDVSDQITVVDDVGTLSINSFSVDGTLNTIAK